MYLEEDRLIKCPSLLPAAKCSVGSVVITQNRAIVCVSSKSQSLLETCQGIAGAAIYSTGSHFGSC